MIDASRSNRSRDDQPLGSTETIRSKRPIILSKRETEFSAATPLSSLACERCGTREFRSLAQRRVRARTTVGSHSTARGWSTRPSSRRSFRASASRFWFSDGPPRGRGRGEPMGSVLRKVLRPSGPHKPARAHRPPVAAWDMYRDMAPHFIAWFVSGVFVPLALPITFYEVRRGPASPGALFRPIIPPNTSRPPRAFPLTLLPASAPGGATPREPPHAPTATPRHSHPVHGSHLRRGLLAALRFKDATSTSTPSASATRRTLSTTFTPTAPCTSRSSATRASSRSSRANPSAVTCPSPRSSTCRRWASPSSVCVATASLRTSPPAAHHRAPAAEANGVYGDGKYQLWVAFPYLALVNNVSQAWAMYRLILFTARRSRSSRPSARFTSFSPSKPSCSSPSGKAGLSSRRQV